MIGADARIPLCGSEQAAASRKDEAYRLPGNEGNCRMAGGLGAIGTQPDWPLLPIAGYNVTVIIANYRRFGV